MNSFSLIKTLRDQLEVENQINEQDNYEVAVQGNELDAQALVTILVEGEPRKFLVRAEALPRVI